MAFSAFLCPPRENAKANLGKNKFGYEARASARLFDQSLAQQMQAIF